MNRLSLFTTLALITCITPVGVTGRHEYIEYGTLLHLISKSGTRDVGLTFPSSDETVTLRPTVTRTLKWRDLE